MYSVSRSHFKVLSITKPTNDPVSIEVLPLKQQYERPNALKSIHYPVDTVSEWNLTSFHAWPFLSMSSARELKASGVTVISLCISSQPWSGNHGNGLVRELFSKEMFPFRKKSSSSGFNLPSASNILMVIWKENNSLWRSNRPVKYSPREAWHENSAWMF